MWTVVVVGGEGIKIVDICFSRQEKVRCDATSKITASKIRGSMKRRMSPERAQGTNNARFVLIA